MPYNQEQGDKWIPSQRKKANEKKPMVKRGKKAGDLFRVSTTHDVL